MVTSAFSSSPSALRAWQLVCLALALSLWTGAVAASQTGRFRSVSGPLLQSHKTRVILSSEHAVGKTFADDTRQHFFESVPVAHLPLIVAERLLVSVTRQVERGYRHVGAFERAFEQRPEVLQPVRVDAAIDVSGDVIDPLMKVRKAQSLITRKGIGKDMTPSLYVAADIGDEGVIIHVGNTHCTDLASAFQQALDDGFADRTPPAYFPFALALVHVPGLATDECLIDFNFAAELAERASLHGESDAVEHEPSGLLRDFKRTGKLTRAYPILGVSNAPDGYKPLIEPEGTVLENRANFNRELLAAILGFALKYRPGPDDPYPFTTALRTGDFPIRPLGSEHGFKARFWLTEVTDGG